KGDRLQRGSDDVDGARVQAKPADRALPSIAPARRPFARQVREDREAVTVRRQRGQGGFDLLVAPEPQYLARPRINVTALRGRTSPDGMATVDAVAQDSLRRGGATRRAVTFMRG